MKSESAKDLVVGAFLMACLWFLLYYVVPLVAAFD